MFFEICSTTFSGSIFKVTQKYLTKYILGLNRAFTMKKCCDKIINNRGRILKSETFFRHGT